MAGCWVAGGISGTLLRIFFFLSIVSQSSNILRQAITSQGAHLNPAMSFAMACSGKRKKNYFKINSRSLINELFFLDLTVQWRKLPLYWLAQYIGAFAAAACVFAVYIGVLYLFYPYRIFQ